MPKEYGPVPGSSRTFDAGARSWKMSRIYDELGEIELASGETRRCKVAGDQRK